MKNRLLPLILLLLATTLSAKANPVDMRTTREVAMKFVNANAKAPLRGAEDLQLVTTYRTESGTDAFHVFNTPNGFVIVAADDVAHPVLAYGFDHPWPSDGNLPPQITDYLDDLAHQIEAASNQLQDHGIVTEWSDFLSGHYQAKGNRTQVGPLLTTTWDQGIYYNAMCPEVDEGVHAVTGCVATAMAQIINYHQYPTSGRGTHSYQSSYGELFIDYTNEIYDYDNMPDTLSSECSLEEINAVAQLIRDCGVAMNMEYTSWESSAYDMDARAAMINFFRYSPNMSFAEKSFFSNDEWHTMLRNDLDAGNPVYYSGQGTGRHAFVCDGYDTDGFFSFNFGWSGYCDGWYLTGAVNPGDMTFNTSQAAVFGIVPDATGNVILGQMQGTSTFVVDEPLEFYHLMGHNAYMGNNYNNPCGDVVTFISAVNESQMVVDIMEFNYQNVEVYDGDQTEVLLRGLHAGDSNDLSPIVSTENTVTMYYSGSMCYAGFHLHVSQDIGCRMVSNVISSVDSTTVHLSWTENGEAIQWQVEYGEKGFSHGEGMLMLVNDSFITIESLQTFKEYDFYIRSVCGANQFGYWNKVTLLIEAPYWTDVVLSQPNGYIINDNMNWVEISTAEGFAWWAKTEYDRDAYLTADIDLSGYKWYPMVLFNNLYGNGHIISNVYIRENTNYVGLFAVLYGVIDHLGLTNAQVKGLDWTGGFCGYSDGIIKNSYVINSVIEGTNTTGGLLGASHDGNIFNSYANVRINIKPVYTEGCPSGNGIGILLGILDRGIVRNCYATGMISGQVHPAGIVDFVNTGTVKNCYTEFPGIVVGSEGNASINDTSAFIRDETGFSLMTPVAFEETTEIDLLSALNCGVEEYNDSTFFRWIEDTNNSNKGYPVFGEKYTVTCTNTSNLSIENVKTNDTYTVKVNWSENGDATQWEIRYRRHDLPNSGYTVVNTNNRPETLYGVPMGYAYDFNVRAVCDAENHSAWGSSKTFLVDLLYWTDVVTKQPAGFVEDSEGNVVISTAEGLAWLSVLVNGFHDQEPCTFEGKSVTITADIDLQGYRWYPIGRYIECYERQFSGWFDGRGHTISNIYVNDGSSELGLFGHISNARIRNVNMNGGYVASVFSDTEMESLDVLSSAIGGLAGFVCDCYEIDNCHSSVDVFGRGNVGSLCGKIMNFDHKLRISNSSASGTVSGREGCGGLIGHVYGNVEICNNYALGDVCIGQGSETGWYRGGLIGNFMMARVTNCYATGNVYIDTADYCFIGKVIGCPYIDTYIHNIYCKDDSSVGWELIGNYCEDIADTAQFHHNEYFNTLLTPVVIDNVSYDDLLEALNAWVETYDTLGIYRHWVADTAIVNGGFPIFDKPSTTTQTTHFNNGWTWWSSYVELGNDGLAQLQDGLGTNGHTIKSQDEGFISYLEGFGWYGTLAELHNEQSYHVKLNAPCTVSLQGIPTNPADHPISIGPGWTWIGFPWSQSLSIETAFEGFNPEANDIIKGQNAYTMYYAENGYSFWFGPLNSFEPGRGYVYCSNSGEVKTLIYPADGAKGNLKPNQTTENNHWQPNLNAYPDNMSVMAVVELDGNELQGENYELAAFANGEVRGSARLLYVEPLNRYMAFLTIAGDEAAELYFGLYDTETGAVETQCVASLQYETNVVVGSFAEPYVISFRGTTGTDEWVNNLLLYPNPVGRGQTVSLGFDDAETGEVCVEIVNALGMVVETQCSASPQTIHAPNTAGVYTLRITMEGKGTGYRKLVVKE